MLKQNELKTEVYLLQDILKWISEGKLRVPKFQRSFVWDEQQMIDLFESIANDYPIGSLLFWNTDKEYQSFDNIGPHEINKNQSMPNNYILDGHQRLSTLFGALIKPISSNYKNEDNYWKWEIFYDLKEQNFLHRKRTSSEVYVIPIYAMFNTFEFLNATKLISKFEDDAKTYIKRLESLYNTMRNFRIAVIQIKSEDLDQAIQIFSKLNSTGVTITPVQMYEALTYDENRFNLTDEIEEIQNQLKILHFKLDRTFIFRSILSMLDIDIYTHNIERLAHNPKINLEKGISNCKEALGLSIDFLVSELGVFIRELLPYKLQLLYLGVFFNNCPEPNSEQKRILKKWFWKSTYAGYFASTHTRMVRDGLNEIKLLAKGNLNDFPSYEEMTEIQKFPKSYNTRSARVKAFLLFLNSLEPRSFEDKDKNKINLKHEYVDYGLGVVSKFFHKNQHRANKFISTPLSSKKTNDLITLEYDDELFLSNAINIEAFNAYQDNKIEEFIAIRENLIASLEQKFINNNTL
ncbi:MAG: DUF262 domain-containing protein [Ignavibacteriae bacterium]|nr:DUF262 domain-containing protein [Ignavibacteriota bacterium]